MKGVQLTGAVRARREELGYSQQKVATVAKCSLTTVRNAENGWMPSARMQKALARALETTRESLWP